MDTADDSGTQAHSVSSPENREERGIQKESCATLGQLVNRLRPRIGANVTAYLAGLFFVLILGFAEIHRVEVYEKSFAPLAPDSPLPADRRGLIPDPDGVKWVIYTQKAWETGSLRTPRWTDADNFPTGRLVCWSSPPMWWLELTAMPLHYFGGMPMTVAIERVAPHYNTTIWIFAAATFGWICVLAFGWRGACILPLLYSSLLLTKYGIYSPDHHLWILLAAVGTLVCLAAPFAMEGRCRQKLWFVGGALFTAFGFWVSAASTAVVVAGIFLGFLFIPAKAAASVDSRNWRLYGYVASLVGIGTYLYEFLPNLSIHLETNNPVYSAALLTAGIWFWQAHEFAASGRRFDSLNARFLVYSALGFSFFLVPVVVNLPYCFSLANPYFQRWEAQISEEQPIDIQGYALQFAFLFAAVAAAAASLYSGWKSRSAGLRAALVMVLGLALFHGYFGISSNRFMEVVLACLCIVAALGMPSRREDLAAVAALFFSVLFCFTALHRSFSSTKTAIIYGMPDQFASTWDLRVVSGRLLRMEGGKDGGILAPSNESTFLNYYTKQPVYGTAYWENPNGLIFTYSVLFDERPEGAQGWPRVQAKLKGHKVSRIAIPKGFTYASSYMIYGQNRITDPKFTFAYFLIHTEKDKLPAWLTLEQDDEKYRIFTVNGAL
jgi:hypothetical protein